MSTVEKVGFYDAFVRVKFRSRLNTGGKDNDALKSASIPNFMNDKDFYEELDLRNVLMTVITPLSKDRRKIEVK